MSDDDSTVLSVRDYSLDYATREGPVRALREINLSIMRGRTLGLVGESGSGKSSLAWSILRALPPNARELGGTIRLLGEDLRQRTRREIAAIRGARIGIVFQDPSTSLNPTLTLGAQIAEVLVRHRGLARKEALAEGERLLARTGIARPADMMRRYPHQASGGEKQRVVIATAFACNPECIIFDEPTTALDIITARQILDLFAELQRETQVAALYISHDLALVARVADEVAVIDQGVIVEQAPAAALFAAPRGEYTKALLAAVPDPRRRLVNAPPDIDAPPVFSVNRLCVRYGQTSALMRLLGRAATPVAALTDIGFSLRRGEILGIVGESGSGKSTLARAIVGLEGFAGEIRLGEDSFSARPLLDRAYRRAVQIVFQNPDASLNPRQRVGDILARPLKLYGLARGADIASRVAALLTDVRLPPDFAGRYPHQLSGGEKQRVAIARAFAAEPRIVICDEITSSLDVSVQAVVVRLLLDLRARTGASCLFVTHDLNLVRQIAHRIAVLYRGDLVDLFEVDAFDVAGRHPYTRALLEAVPIPVAS
jgi:peptide/nickel transport system ATP-binding protein